MTVAVEVETTVCVTVVVTVLGPVEVVVAGVEAPLITRAGPNVEVLSAVHVPVLTVAVSVWVTVSVLVDVVVTVAVDVLNEVLVSVIVMVVVMLAGWTPDEVAACALRIIPVPRRTVRTKRSATKAIAPLRDCFLVVLNKNYGRPLTVADIILVKPNSTKVNLGFILLPCLSDERGGPGWAS